jgi:hypothetical protein
MFSHLNYWLLRNDTSYKNMNSPVVNIRCTCTSVHTLCIASRIFFIIAGNVLFSLYLVLLDETCNLWSKHYDNSVALIVLLPKAAPKKSLPWRQHFYWKELVLQQQVHSYSDTCVRWHHFRHSHWNKLALKFSHVINMYFALFVHFSFKRISCLKRMKSSWCNRLCLFGICYTLKSYTVFPGSLLFSVLNIHDLMISVHEG